LKSALPAELIQHQRGRAEYEDADATCRHPPLDPLHRPKVLAHDLDEHAKYPQPFP
jgi:hypothetical protein